MKTWGFKRLFFCACLFTMITAGAFAAENPKELAGKTIDKALSFDGKEYPYKIYLPTGYDGVKKYPVVVSLHGLGGNIGSYAGVGRGISTENYIIVTPQAPFPYSSGFSWLAGNSQGNSESSLKFSENIVFAALNDAISNYNGKEDNVFLTGLSQGGHMTYVMGMRNYKRFKGLIPCAGAYLFFKDLIGDNMEKAKDIPILQTVGRQDCRGDDGLYPMNLKANKALREIGYDARILTYPIAHTLYSLQLKDINDWIQLQLLESRATADILEDLAKADGFDRLPLVISLAMNDDDEAIGYIEKLASEGKSNDELCAAATGLILNKNNEKADAILRILLKSGDAQVRRSAIHATGMRASEGMAQPLLKILKDTSEQTSVRKEAFFALQKFGEADNDEAMTRWVILKITEVVEGGTASAVGMKAGDIIVEYDGKAIKSQQQFLQAAKAAARKERVAMVVKREGERMQFTVKGGKLGIRITSELQLRDED